MDKLKRFIDCYIPVEACNLRCGYCYVTQERKFETKIERLEHSSSLIRQALSVARLGGICLINMCAAGETLLAPELIDITRGLLEEGHYVMIVTNGTLTERLVKFTKLERRLLDRLLLKFSFHYAELQKRNLLQKFFDNITLVREAGCSYSVELTPTDETIPQIDEIREICLRRVGALCHLTVARDITRKEIAHLSKHPFNEYKKIWSAFGSKMFDFKTDIFYKKRKEFCYAGDWSALVHLGTGDLMQCYCGKSLGNIFTNCTERVNFSPIGYKCNMPHCFNGHAFLTLGTIPALETPSFDKMRDREDPDSGPWLKPKMKSFLSQRLKDNNEQKGYWERVISRFHR